MKKKNKCTVNIVQFLPALCKLIHTKNLTNTQ